jgi:hypothetical protein
MQHLPYRHLRSRTSCTIPRDTGTQFSEKCTSFILEVGKRSDNGLVEASDGSPRADGAGGHEYRHRPSRYSIVAEQQRK